MTKAVNVNQLRLFIVIIKNTLQVFETVIFMKPPTAAPAYLALARQPCGPVRPYFPTMHTDTLNTKHSEHWLGLDDSDN